MFEQIEQTHLTTVITTNGPPNNKHCNMSAVMTIHALILICFYSLSLLVMIARHTLNSGSRGKGK